MANSTQNSELTEALSRYRPDNMAEIIDRLAGDKDNLRVDVKAVKLTVRNTKLEVNGVINFYVVHKTPDVHQKIERN
jgi:hypothetical protein